MLDQLAVLLRTSRVAGHESPRKRRIACNGLVAQSERTQLDHGPIQQRRTINTAMHIAFPTARGDRTTATTGQFGLIHRETLREST